MIVFLFFLSKDLFKLRGLTQRDRSDHNNSTSVKYKIYLSFSCFIVYFFRCFFILVVTSYSCSKKTSKEGVASLSGTVFPGSFALYIIEDLKLARSNHIPPQLYDTFDIDTISTPCYPFWTINCCHHVVPFIMCQWQWWYNKEQ